MLTTPPVSLPRAGRVDWGTVAWLTAGVVAASQLRLVMWVPAQIGIGGDVTRSVIAAVGFAVFCRAGGRVRPCPVPGGARHRYRRFERLNAGVLGWAFATFAAMVLSALARWVADPPPLGDQALAAGASVVDAAAAGWNDAVAPALSEEFVFRYLLLGFLLLHMSTRRAVAVQAVAFGVAHTAVGVGGGLIASGGSYPLDAALHSTIFGLLFGYLAVELGLVWPAVAVHAAGNALVTFEVVAPWLVTVMAVVVPVVLMVAMARGVMGMQFAVPLPARRRWGVSVARQRRVLKRFGPLFGVAPELRRPIAWIVPREMAQRPSVDG